MIVARFDPDDPADQCCRYEIIPMFLGVLVGSDDPGLNLNDYVVLYTGTVAGITIEVTLTTYPLNSESQYDRSCYWTIKIDQLGINKRIEIDHQVVTCLGVPAIEVENVTAYESCTGTLSLSNFEAELVPFQYRQFPSSFDRGDPESLLVDVPEMECIDCDWDAETSVGQVPRFLCLFGVKEPYSAGGFESARIKQEFEWDFDYLQTLVDNPLQGEFYAGDVNPPRYLVTKVLGRWRSPLYNTTTGKVTRIDYIYLCQDYTEYDSVYGDTIVRCDLRTDFKTPPGFRVYDTIADDGTIDEHGEIFPIIPLSSSGSCGCGLELTVFSDKNFDPFRSPHFKLTSGRCQCYQHFCGDSCRCLPKYLCGMFYDENGDFWYNILFTWNPTRKSYQSTGGAQNNGDELSTSLEIRLQNIYGECWLTWEYSGEYAAFDIEPQQIQCTLQPLLSATFYGYSDDRAVYLHVHPAFEGNCEELIVCNEATPCATNCGSHPKVLIASLWAGNPPGVGEPGFYSSCAIDVTLVYYEEVFILGDAEIEIGCGYRGFHVLECINFLGDPEYLLLSFEYKNGVLTIDQSGVSPRPGTGGSEMWEMAYETCDPYYSHFYAEYPGPSEVLWCCGETIQAVQIVILEA